jgi:hypothetical protein
MRRLPKKVWIPLALAGAAAAAVANSVDKQNGSPVRARVKQTATSVANKVNGMRPGANTTV